MPVRDLDLVMEPRSDITVFANRGVSGAIDGFVSTALGIAVARPGRPTVALCGDLSLLHDSNGFLVGTGEQPDVTFVVINNDGGGIFSLLHQAGAVPNAAFERLFGTPHGARIDALAAAYNVEYRLVATTAELTEARCQRRAAFASSRCDAEPSRERRPACPPSRRGRSRGRRVQGHGA